MNDSAPPSPLSAAGKVAPPAGGSSTKKTPEPPQPMRSSISPLVKEEEKVDTSEAVSILKHAAQETLKSSQVRENKIPRPAKIDGKAVERFPAQIEEVVPKNENGLGSSEIRKTPSKVTHESAPVVSPKVVENVPAEVIKPDVFKPEAAKREPVKQEQFPASKPGVTVEEPAKRPWWKFWGKTPEIAVDCKAGELVEGAKRPLTEEELVNKRHEALIDSVNQICHSLEASTNRPIEVKAADLVPLIPGDNIDTLNRTQELVSGVLKQVSGRLEKAGERDAVMIDSLSSMDKSITSLNDVGERTITTMDGMKGILSQVSGAMVTMQTELKQSSKRYEELLKQVQKTESENIVKVQKLQKSTLWVNVILGITVVAGLIAVAISKAG